MAGITCAQTIGAPVLSLVTENPPSSGLSLPVAVPLPRMAPELALKVFTERSSVQAASLAGYQDHTTIEAVLPDTRQKGEYELLRTYTADPRSLSYRSIRYTGDGFVKTNVIIRLLQSEVDHIDKGNPSDTALTEQNYKFSYKGEETVNGSLTHVFQVKPRHKKPGLFKGKIFVDAYTGSLRRMEGTLAKSPSFFVRKVEFVQDFTDVDGFTVPTMLRSTAKARIIGRAIVTILHKAYEVKTFGGANAADALQTRAAAN